MNLNTSCRKMLQVSKPQVGALLLWCTQSSDLTPNALELVSSSRPYREELVPLSEL